ncbi:ATP-dependent DNA helicase RecG [Serinibacter arcticus]|uniref:ATP-dependent DNA helicase RecG n=1 Tax=Serinibacter arcticus TaxID=1655435 RepID=UPI001F47DCB2|nr:ATP-dependent DNA helicase RecG [Serinibacter arcticus]
MSTSGPKPPHHPPPVVDGIVQLNPLDRRVSKVISARPAKALEKIGIHTVRDLLGHYPRRYSDPGRLTDLSDLVVGEPVVLVVDIASFTSRRTQKGGYLITVEVTDGVRRLPTVFFPRHRGSVQYYERILRVGQRVTVEGTIGLNRGVRQITHPDIEGIDEEMSEEEIAERASRPRPVYPLTGSLNQKQLRAVIRAQLLTLDDRFLADPVPAEVRAEHGLLSHAEAIRLLHDPETAEDHGRAREALRFEEAFVLQSAMARRRAEAAAVPATARPPRSGGIADAFDARLPFELTPGQREVGDTIAAEIAGTVPMQRLLQGEVGSGKTVVALRAMLQVVDGGGQAALLAPTEVLAAQHERSIRALLGELGEAGMLGGADAATRVVLLTGSQTAAQRRRALGEAAGGSAGIVIGTHALLQEHVQFADLGLVVVDEQHRFGVEQRDALRAKGRAAPHLLVMTATPIPRTVAMTIFGDLEISTLRDLPSGRAEVTTVVVPAENEAWMARTWARVAEEVRQGRRAFVVCPRISATQVEPGTPPLVLLPEGAGADDVEDLFVAAAAAAEADAPAPAPRELAAVEDVLEELRGNPDLAGITIEALHGRLAAEEKEAAMAAFSSGETGVLVATTVIEVGVDVPEASAMVVLDADRFGLSQLHQLRGRIGRGSLPGICLAVTAATPLSAAGERLAVFASTRDGFVLAEADLGQRREGDVLGAAQSGGSSSLRLLRVVSDADVIEQARGSARAVVEQDPDLAAHPALAEAIARALDPEAEEFLERS